MQNALVLNLVEFNWKVVKKLLYYEATPKKKHKRQIGGYASSNVTALSF
jgi:hypothetical protein